MNIAVLSFMCTSTLRRGSEVALDKDLYGLVQWLLLGKISTHPALTTSKGDASVYIE